MCEVTRFMINFFRGQSLFFSLLRSVVCFIGKISAVLKCLCGLLVLTLLGCTFAENKMVAGNIAAINHVEGTAINWFSVNGYRAHGGGGSSCCIIMPVKWRPGLKMDIEWEVDPNSDVATPPIGTNEFKAFMVKHKSNYRRYSAVVDVPEWPERKLCSLNVHFLTCKRVEVTTSCWVYGHPSYPIQEPLDMKEPAVCPN
ncbi:DUF3304 domain-containing protein [Pseudomonas sp. FP2335]|uniref:DUF3304 domain-containing protein n=1 Tax=Pseudomonas sp. FP2335 TaxID=2954092 RepID=UPI0027364629|nr:DUF3304 domain-containing protein [Pseudomonas sp. FP2335]WLH77390.1 DUF3304 domain-containing protein [Pseudomonas sp. FP2335]